PPRGQAAQHRPRPRARAAARVPRAGHPPVQRPHPRPPQQTYDSFADSMAKAVTPYPGDAFNLYLARVLPNAEMASPEERARHGIETRHVLIASFHRAGAGGHVDEVEEVVVATRALPVADWPPA